jgi:hypothetical protein
LLQQFARIGRNQMQPEGLGRRAGNRFTQSRLRGCIRAPRIDMRSVASREACEFGTPASPAGQR